MVYIAVAYVEGRDEADRGTSNQPLTQVSKSMSYFILEECLLHKLKLSHDVPVMNYFITNH